MGKTKQVGNQLQIEREDMPIFTMQEQELFAPEAFEAQLAEQVQLADAYKEETPDTLALYREKTAEMKDTAKLGSISIKGEKSVRHAKNEKIRRSRALTEKATADTEEIYTQLTQITQEPLQQEPQTALSFLEQYRFTPQMFTSGSIRENFKEYVNLVRSYRKLQEQAKGQQNTVFSVRLEALSPIMEAFSHRLTVYCEQNRVSLAGGILADKQKAAQLSKEEIEGWYTLVTARAQETEELPQAQETSLTAEALRERYFQMTALLEDAEVDEASDANMLAGLRLQTQRCQADYLLALRREECESRRQKGEDVSALEEKLRALQADARRLAHREMRMEMGMKQVSDKTQPVRRTREEAISTHSDLKSYQSRDELSALCRALQTAGGAPELVAKLEQYVKGTRYRVGYTKERENLQAARKAVEEALQGETSQQLRDALTGVKTYFDRMTNGTLVIPQGATVLDYTNKRPQEKGRGGKGSTRNAMIRKVSYWSNQKDTPLFAHEPTINDLKQRLVSNCYMMAATAGLVEFSPELLKDCIVDEGDSVVVRLYEWQEVEQEQPAVIEPEDELLDDKDDMVEITLVPKRELVPIYVRVNKEIPRIAGADALSSGALWMQMIEKACAFVGREGITGYQSLWYGDGGDFLERLLGISPKPVDTEDTDALFEEIRTGRERGYVYNAGTDAGAGSEDGLNGGHAYTVMGAKEINGKKYALLRNPYSTYSLQYQEDGSKSRTGDLINVSSDETYGQFYIEVNDFARHFGRVTRTNVGRRE